MSSQPSVPPDRRRFGQFEIDISTGELRKNGLRMHIQEQPLRILGALLERPGELVTREELRERLWPAATFVNFERSLNAAVAKLRQVLADSAEQPRYVETVARRGYRFVAPVEASLPLEGNVGLPIDSISEGRGGSILRRKRKQWVWPALALILIVLVSTGIYLLKWRYLAFSKTEAVSFAVQPPEATKIHVASAVSPDGRKLAFVAIDPSGHRTLWVRTLTSETALRLENTDGALMPFFSPDSQNIGFFADGKLKRIQASGGSPQTLCDQSQAAGGTWNRDDIILFSQEGRLYRVSAAGGGSATQLPQPDNTPGTMVMDAWPQFLPDGRHFVFCARTLRGSVNPTRSGIILGSLDSTIRKFLLASRTGAAVTPSGYVLFVRNGTLLARRLDLSRFQFVGEPSAVAENLTVNLDRISNAAIPRRERDAEVKAGQPGIVPPAAFSVSGNGVLAYHSAPPQKSELVWYGRDGKRMGTAGEPREYNQLFLSPDKRLAAVSIRNDKKDRTHWNIWLLQLDTNVLSRLTFGDGLDADPVWSPDSRKIVYGAYKAEESEKIDLMELTLGERSPRLFYTDGRANKPEAWSQNGRFLFKREEQTIFSLPISGDRKSAMLLDTPYAKGRFQFSPDGHWLAYMSLDSGAEEVYVSSFPAMTGTRQISTGGGCTPLWSQDGKELFYMAGPGQVMSVDVKAGSSLETSVPKMLFRTGEANYFTRDYCIGQYGATGDGQKFLLIEPARSPIDGGRMHVVTNWDAALPH